MTKWVSIGLSTVLFAAVLSSQTAVAAPNKKRQEKAKPKQREWPFYVPSKVAIPKVKQQKWVRNPIDSFILAKLESKQLQPAREASRYTLIRRLYFDLLGVPPRPKDVAKFVQDKDPRAYEKLVDQLLKDPRYGERWARYWLDLARYADTAGYEGDPDLPHAWRYRDYVIDSLNRDKPYDLFIKEQLAGDEFAEVLGAGELPNVRPERIVAMTFLRLAPFTEPRGDETRHEMLSEMTTTVSSVFLGLTVGCAKCHDHKYDKIPTADFYRMKAFLATIQIPPPARGDGFQIGGSLPAAFYRQGEAQWARQKEAQLEKEAAEAKTRLAKLTATIQKRLGEVHAGFGVQSMGGGLGNNYFYQQAQSNDGNLHHSVLATDGGSWQFFTDGKGPAKIASLSGTNAGHWFGDLGTFSHISLGKHTNGTGRPSNAPHQGVFAELLIYDHPLSKKEHLLLGQYVAARYRKKGKQQSPPKSGLKFWLDAADLDGNAKTKNPAPGHKVDRWVDKIGGIELVQPGKKLQPQLVKLAASVGVKFTDHFLVATDVTKASFRKDQTGSLVVIYTATHQGEGYGFELGGGGSFISTVSYPQKGGSASVARIIGNPKDARVSLQERRQFEYLSNRGKFLAQHKKRLQPVAMSLRHSFGPPYEPSVPTSRIMIRGEYDNPGKAVKPGFLSAITGHQKPAKIRLDPFKRWPTRSRRMALAKWIASPQNPMTARVIANRLWYRHFGRGIVATPSDFGVLSNGPSHRLLLDYLATQLIKYKWRLKPLHKLMVMSATYRQDSVADSRLAAKTDPDNLLLWKFRRRRLEAEAIRDSVLAVSGRLNPEMFGLPIFPPLPGDIAQRVKYSNSKWDTNYGPGGRKRSIYIYQQRTLSMPLMQVFDAVVCDESRPRRRVSTTPLQALAMYNSEFVNEEAGHFAKRLAAKTKKLEEQIRDAFQIALCRPVTEKELKRLKQFIATSKNRREGLLGLCRILLNSNEFVYVD